MGIKRKTIGVIFCLSVATCTVAGAAYATTGGHFVSAVSHTRVTTTTHLGKDEGELFIGGNQYICGVAQYEATATGTTATEVVVVPTYELCATPAEELGKVKFTRNGCVFRLTIGKKAAGEENTVHIECPFGQQMEISHTNCLMKIPPQTVSGGLRFTTTVQEERHRLTVDIATTFTVHREASPCFFLGTTQSGTLSGSITTLGRDQVGNTVDITATGSEG